MENQQPVIQNEEGTSLSMKELLGIAKEYFIEVLKYSWLIAIGAILLGTYMRNRKLSAPTTYTADFSFAVNEKATQSQQNIASIFGNIAASDAEINIPKLERLLKTRKVISNVLFHRISLANEEHKKDDFIINHYLRNFYYNETSKDPFYFGTDSINPYDRRANSLLKYVHNVIVTNHIIFDPEPFVVHLKVTSTSEDFSYELVMALYEELNKYFSAEALDQKERFFKMAEDRTDQLRGKLDAAEKRYIDYVNTHTLESDGRQNTRIKIQYLSTELKRATTAYFNALSSMEAAWVSLKEQEQAPSMIMIDPPLYPLTRNVPNPFLRMILGGIIGGGLIFIGVVGRKFMRDNLGKQKEEVLVPESEKEINTIA